MPESLPASKTAHCARSSAKNCPSLKLRAPTGKSSSPALPGKSCSSAEGAFRQRTQSRSVTADQDVRLHSDQGLAEYLVFSTFTSERLCPAAQPLLIAHHARSLPVVF